LNINLNGQIEVPSEMLSDAAQYPMTVGLQAWFAQATQKSGNSVLFNIVIMGALVSIIPLITAFLFLQRYWQGGINTGSLK
jgi:multiple sugar transport system permease protein